MKGIIQLTSEINNPSVNAEWKTLTTKIKSFESHELNENRKQKSEQFLFWHSFIISKVFPGLRHLESSHRQKNWKLHLSAIQEDGWLPIYFEIGGYHFILKIAYVCQRNIHQYTNLSYKVNL